ncbi:unnamed protein product [Dibothriocephalus latus]|uniref:MABP domain-containing protein n=1 Tax=Dibothriocephalus latus TaxID=60516 RepID=A0A3P7LGM5_DIBLA|nr:unnamed protein product [Dibothriocephalus latus]
MSSAPITGVAFFTSLSKVPPNYTVLARTKDTHEDADLGKETIFKKSARYLGYEKAPFDPQSPPKVLVELIIANEKEPVRSGFQAIDKTHDTHSSAPAKRPAPKPSPYPSLHGDSVSSPIFQPMFNRKSPVRCQYLPRFGELLAPSG